MSKIAEGLAKVGFEDGTYCVWAVSPTGCAAPSQACVAPGWAWNESGKLIRRWGLQILPGASFQSPGGFGWLEEVPA